MLQLGGRWPGPVTLVGLVMMVPVLAGCTNPAVPSGPEGFHAILVETTYDASERHPSRDRPQDRATDLPAGHAAEELELWFRFIGGGPGYDGATWEYDAPCPNGESPHGPWSDCERFEPQDAYILPSPQDAREHPRIKYPLDRSGRIMFYVPQAVEVGFEVNDRYTDELWQRAADPDGCSEPPMAFSGRTDVDGQAERSGPSAFVLNGDVRLVVRWYGTCPDDVAS